MEKPTLSFDEWYAVNEDAINIELAETGATSELDYNPELEFDKRYEEYLNNVKLCIS